MNEKRQQLTFERGITNVPSDATCSDNELAECVGMVYEGGEHKPIQAPALYASSVPNLIYVHRHNGAERYITLSNGYLKWGTIVSGVYTHVANLKAVSGDVHVTSTGKILVVNDNNGLDYFLWKGNAYNEYSSAIPEIMMDLWLDDNKQLNTYDPYENPTHVITVQDWATTTINSNGIALFSLPTEKDKHDTLQDAIIGAVSEKINTLHKLGAFCSPFWVRYGIVLYDGTVTHLSVPILAMPTVLHSTYLDHTNDNGDNEYTTSNRIGSDSISLTYKFKPNVGYGFLRAKLDASTVATLNEWRDLISAVRIYVSDEVKSFDMEGTWRFYNNIEETGDPAILLDSVCRREWPNSLLASSASSWHKYSAKKATDDQDNIVRENTTTYIIPKYKAEEEFKKDLINQSVFYELLDIDIADISTSVVNVEDKIGKNTLQNITTRTQLKEDDYFSHAKIKADNIFAYNGRLNISGITRIPYEGTHQFMLCDSLSTYKFTIRVYIDADGEEVVASHYIEGCKPMLGKYFYYPDPRAKRVEIYQEGVDANYQTVWKLIYTHTLREHPSLHGAYWFGALPDGNDKEYIQGMGYYDSCYPEGEITAVPALSQAVERLNGQIQTSEVDNPFLFLAKGTYYLSVGKIIGLSVNTKALSEGQHGQYPLLVFTSEGVWALSVNKEGYYDSQDPISREVVNSEKPCIIQTDNSVYFASAKGLMRVDGSSVVCVSTLNKDIAKMLKTSFVAYDYKHSLLWIVGAAPALGTQKCYIYNMVTGTFSTYARQQPYFTSMVNLYPDTLLCDASNNVYSLLDIPEEDDDTNTYAAIIESRPMKLENALALKSILEVRHIAMFHPYNVTTTVNGEDVTSETRGHMSFQVFASNNLEHWVELSSLHGAPWKYYKFKYTFENMKATDRYAGTLLTTQERRYQKMR